MTELERLRTLVKVKEEQNQRLTVKLAQREMEAQGLALLLANERTHNERDLTGTCARIQREQAQETERLLREAEVKSLRDRIEVLEARDYEAERVALARERSDTYEVLYRNAPVGSNPSTTELANALAARAKARLELLIELKQAFITAGPAYALVARDDRHAPTTREAMLAAEPVFLRIFGTVFP